MIDPQMEWIPMDGTLLGGPFRGHHEVRGFLETIMDAWDEFRIEPEDFIEREDQVLALVRVRTRARASGIELDERWAHLWTARTVSPYGCRCSATAERRGRRLGRTRSER